MTTCGDDDDLLELGCCWERIDEKSPLKTIWIKLTLSWMLGERVVSYNTSVIMKHTLGRYKHYNI